MTCSNRSSRHSLLVTLVLSSLLTSNVSAHFTLVGSREDAAYHDNRRFWPIAGGGVLRPVLDCLKIDATPRKKSLQAGSSITLPFIIGNGARHVGPCTAQLIDAESGSITDLGSQADCVNKFDAMTVQIPPTATCSNCVVKVKVMATHLGANNPEFYDSCLDVNVSGGSTPAYAGSKHAFDLAPSQPSETPVSDYPTHQVKSTTLATMGQCTSGDMRCDGSTAFVQCTPAQSFEYLPVPAGTKCQMVDNKSIYFSLV